jgi:mono/diheme cytochrome c family protein
MIRMTRPSSDWHRSPLLLLGVALLLLSPLVNAAIQGTSGDSSLTGEQLYRKACASCHGANGKGAPSSRVGFDTPLPDFTDCSFASREPSADWAIVAHEGGPVRGFSELMPAFGSVLTLEQLESIVAYVRGFCPDKRWPPGELNLPRALFTEKAYPEDELVLTTAVATEGPTSVVNRLVFEKRFGARSQFEIAFPFGWREVPATDGAEGDTRRAASLGDIAFGVKHAFYHNLRRGAILSIAGEIFLPSGDDDTGFAKGTVVFEPFLSYGQLLPAELFLHGQAGLGLPVDRDKAESEAFLRLVLGRSFTSGRFGRTWSPMIEAQSWRELASGEDTNWDLVPQFQVTLNTRQHIMLNAGVRAPMNNRSERDTAVVVYLLWDWFDGGFGAGW